MIWPPQDESLYLTIIETNGGQYYIPLYNERESKSNWALWQPQNALMKSVIQYDELPWQPTKRLANMLANATTNAPKEPYRYRMLRIALTIEKLI